jgi:hypothetical protein
MKIQERIIRRKIGAFELLIGALPIEAVFGTWARFVLLGVLAALFYAAKKEFQGEFSLQQVFALFSEGNQPKKDSKQ